MPRLPHFAACFFVGLSCTAALMARSCAGPQRPSPNRAEWSADSATVRIAAGPQYQRGAVWRLFFGTHYRAIWATPVTVPVMRLATALPGGLTPMRAGGSFQSRTLRVCAANGHEYVLRSVDKDASAALPAGWKRRALGRLMKDQTSAAQPYGAYVAAQLAEAAGVYHTNPKLVYLADDPLLGKFRARYANALYLFEERPEGNQISVASFGRSAAVVNTARMLTDLRRRPTARVDARAYLRARLLDIWLGDWSRREDQWRWASFAQGGTISYRPIPRDRDQAFFLFDDGVITRLVSWFIPKYHSFHSTIKSTGVNGLTITARNLDRTLLGLLSAEDFRREADSLRLRVSDAAINEALAAGPPETRAAVAAKFAPLLRARREQLPGAAYRFYRILSGESWLIGTDHAERFVLTDVGAGKLQVQMLAQRAGKPDSLLVERTYDRRETYQVNLYGLAADDTFEFAARYKPGLSVHILDGAGRDRVKSLKAQNNKIEDVTWYSSSDGNTCQHLPGIIIKPNPDAALTANYIGWLKRYNLRD